MAHDILSYHQNWLHTPCRKGLAFYLFFQRTHIAITVTKSLTHYALHLLINYEAKFFLLQYHGRSFIQLLNTSWDCIEQSSPPTRGWQKLTTFQEKKPQNFRRAHICKVLQRKHVFFKAISRHAAPALSTSVNHTLV